MILNTLVGRAIIGKEIAKSQGITDPAEQFRLGLIGGLVGSPTLGLVATTAIARQQAKGGDSTGESGDSPPGKSPVKLVKVPDLKKYESVDVAKLVLKEIELKSQVVNVYSAEDGADVIVGQSPAAGEFVSKGTTIEIKVSQDAVVESREGKMPLVKGLSLEAAKAAIIEAGKVSEDNISVVYGLSCSGAKPNEVIMQNPDPDSAIDSQTQPTLMIVSAVDVPDLAGMTAGQAILTLSGKRLTPELLSSQNMSATVVAQTPKSGTSVAIFSAVQLKVEDQSPG